MELTEPIYTALLLTTFGLLLGVSILFSRASERIGVPVALVFLAIGMIAGRDGFGIVFENYAFAFRLGTAALVLILWDGGLNTPVTAVRRAISAAGLLATVGVAGTALIVAGTAHALGFAWPPALLLGAIVSSTDAAAVFAVLRGSGIQLKRRVGLTLEVESGINDPMAVILTVLLTANLINPGEIDYWMVPVTIIREIAIGTAVGAGVGFGGRKLLARYRLPAAGLYPALTLSLAFLAYGVATLAHGSGFLAVYLAAVLIGNGSLPYRASLLRVHDAMAWLSQIGMFLVLGLLVTPSELPGVAAVGTVLALVLAVVARPLVVAVCLAPFHYTKRDVMYVGWVGLRGAVPIILALFPVLAGAPGAANLFNVVFFIVVVNAILPGGTVPWVTKKLGLQSREPPAPGATLEIESRGPLHGELLSFYIEDLLAVTGVPVADLPFPNGAAATLIVRGNDLIAPKGDTVFQPGDHVYVLCRKEDRPMIYLMFGRPE